MFCSECWFMFFKREVVRVIVIVLKNLLVFKRVLDFFGINFLVFVEFFFVNYFICVCVCVCVFLFTYVYK